MSETGRKRYPAEMKEAVIKRMMPPANEPVSKLSKETGITEATLYAWRKKARPSGHAAPGTGNGPNNGAAKTSSWWSWKRTR